MIWTLGVFTAAGMLLHLKGQRWEIHVCKLTNTLTDIYISVSVFNFNQNHELIMTLQNPILIYIVSESPTNTSVINNLLTRL